MPYVVETNWGITCGIFNVSECAFLEAGERGMYPTYKRCQQCLDAELRGSRETCPRSPSPDRKAKRKRPVWVEGKGIVWVKGGKVLREES